MNVQIPIDSGDTSLPEEKASLADQHASSVEEKLYKAEYLGSGTFAISKPKRKKAKIRQSHLKNPPRGARK
jgi:hypothetical protein